MLALLLFIDLLGEFARLDKRVLNISPYAATFDGLMGLHSLPIPLIGLIAGRRRWAPWDLLASDVATWA
ncbi:MAG TPA: hypothetical protein VF086_02480 [Propionibacteriaceae bacterium]